MRPAYLCTHSHFIHFHIIDRSLEDPPTAIYDAVLFGDDDPFLKSVNYEIVYYIALEVWVAIQFEL